MLFRSGFTANTPVGTPGTPIVEGTIDAAETALFLAKVPASEQKFIVVDAVGIEPTTCRLRAECSAS